MEELSIDRAPEVPAAPLDGGGREVLGEAVTSKVGPERKERMGHVMTQRKSFLGRERPGPGMRSGSGNRKEAMWLSVGGEARAQATRFCLSDGRLCFLCGILEWSGPHNVLLVHPHPEHQQPKDLAEA